VVDFAVHERRFFFIPQYINKKRGNIMKEKDFYENLGNWDFSFINCEEERLTNWEFIDELKKIVNEDSKILDLGTGGGEKLLTYPVVKEIVGTDFSSKMIETANKNLLMSGRSDVIFKVMDNLNMNVEEDYFDVVTARNTITDMKEIYSCLKKGGYLLLHGVDKLDCWELKSLFGHGQGFEDVKPISLIDYENAFDAGFIDVELIPLHVREYYKTVYDLLALLYKTPILEDFDAKERKIDLYLLDKYVKSHISEKGIVLVRRYYGIVAKK